MGRRRTPGMDIIREQIPDTCQRFVPRHIKAISALSYSASFSSRRGKGFYLETSYASYV